MQNRWSEEEAQKFSGLHLLVYRSRLIGAEPSLVLWGGGNTSTKRTEKDFRGRDVQVMRVKGSGTDLKSIGTDGFPGVRIDDILPLLEREEMPDEEMVEYLSHCLMEPGSRRPSIETLLHGFLPYPEIDHTHADVILCLSNNKKGEETVQEVFGDEVVRIPYRRPGFLLSKEVYLAMKEHPDARGIVLMQHGLITFGETAKESYDRTIEFVSRAEEYIADKSKGKKVFGAPAASEPPVETRREIVHRLAPILRGAVSFQERQILHFDDSPEVLEFTRAEKSREISQIGPATPDHMMNTRRIPLWFDLPEDPETYPDAVREAVEQFVKRDEEYYERNTDGRHPRLAAQPRVILVPGIGMFTAGKNLQRAKIVAEIYHHTIAALRGASAIAPYRSLSEKDAFDIDYWPLELYKLNLGAQEPELARRVALVTGAARGIGFGAAKRLAEAGGHVVVTDLSEEEAKKAAEKIASEVKGSFVTGLKMDVTDEPDVRRAFEETVRRFGGLDVVVSNAGIAHASPVDRMETADWKKSFDVNATGHFLVSREAVQILKRQGAGGSLVFVVTKNVPAPGKEFGAYSASKAAQAQLARVLALENAEHRIRVNMVNPDAVFGDSGLWSPEVKQERAAAHGIDAEQVEEFYRNRSLLKLPVTAQDVAEAILYLASDRSAKTTAAILPVDAGVKEAFLR